MKRALLIVVLAVAGVVGTGHLTPAFAVQCCWWCEEGVCIPQQPGGPGYTICISTYDPVGCMADQSSACTAGPGNPDLCSPMPSGPLTTLTAVFKLSPGAMNRLFDGQHTRVVRGPGGGFTCAAVSRFVGELAGVSSSPLELAFWHCTVSGGARTFGAEANGIRDGYLFHVAPDWVGQTHVAIYSAQGSVKGREIADARVTTNDMLLVPVTLGGQDYVLATSAHSVAESQLRAIQERFRQSVMDYPNKNRLDLRLIGAEEAGGMML